MKKKIKKFKKRTKRQLLAVSTDFNRVSDAIDMLETGFLWEYTSQGRKYWSAVVDNLSKIKRLKSKD